MSESNISSAILNQIDPRRKLKLVVEDGKGLTTFIVKLDPNPVHRTVITGQCAVLLSEDVASGFTTSESPAIVQARTEVGESWSIYHRDGSSTAYRVVEITLLP